MSPRHTNHAAFSQEGANARKKQMAILKPTGIFLQDILPLGKEVSRRTLNSLDSMQRLKERVRDHSKGRSTFVRSSWLRAIIKASDWRGKEEALLDLNGSAWVLTGWGSIKNALNLQAARLLHVGKMSLLYYVKDMIINRTQL